MITLEETLPRTIYNPGMRIAEGYILEFDPEIANTRRMLELVLEDVLDYQPHPKSMTLARLAGHIAEMGGWGTSTARLDSLDINPASGPPFKPYVATNTADLLDFFDKGIAGAREAILELSDEAMLKPWTLYSGGKELFTMPRIAVLRTMILSHLIHHRAQLGVYLRINDIPIPGMYGPSADDAPQA